MPTNETPERNPNTGNFNESFTPEDVLAALQHLGGQRQTKEVAAEAGCSRPTAHRKLETLAERGQVEKQKFGNVAVWRATDTK